VRLRNRILSSRPFARNRYSFSWSFGRGADFHTTGAFRVDVGNPVRGHREGQVVVEIDCREILILDYRISTPVEITIQVIDPLSNWTRQTAMPWEAMDRYPPLPNGASEG
jgi:hypothetical protein